MSYNLLYVQTVFFFFSRRNLTLKVVKRTYSDIQRNCAFADRVTCIQKARFTDPLPLPWLISRGKRKSKWRVNKAETRRTWQYKNVLSSRTMVTYAVIYHYTRNISNFISNSSEMPTEKENIHSVIILFFVRIHDMINSSCGTIFVQVYVEYIHTPNICKPLLFHHKQGFERKNEDQNLCYYMRNYTW